MASPGREGTQTIRTVVRRSNISIADARRVAQPLGLHGGGLSAPYRLTSIYLSLPLARWGVRPMAITTVWGVLGFVGAVALACPRYSVRLAGALLLEFSYWLDNIDGEVARLLNPPQISKKRALLDRINHSVIKTALFLAPGLYVFRITQQPVYLWLAFSACVFTINHHTAKYYAQCVGLSPSNWPARPEDRGRRPGLARRTINWISLSQETPGLFALALLAVLFRHLDWMLIWYGITAPLWFLFRTADLMSQ